MGGVSWLVGRGRGREGEKRGRREGGGGEREETNHYIKPIQDLCPTHLRGVILQTNRSQKPLPPPQNKTKQKLTNNLIILNSSITILITLPMSNMHKEPTNKSFTNIVIIRFIFE